MNSFNERKTDQALKRLPKERCRYGRHQRPERSNLMVSGKPWSRRQVLLKKKGKMHP